MRLRSGGRHHSDPAVAPASGRTYVIVVEVAWILPVDVRREYRADTPELSASYAWRVRR